MIHYKGPNALGSLPFTTLPISYNDDSRMEVTMGEQSLSTYGAERKWGTTKVEYRLLDLNADLYQPLLLIIDFHFLLGRP